MRKGLITVDTNYLIGNYNIKRDLLYFDKLIYDSDELRLTESIVDPVGKSFIKDKDFRKIIDSKIADLAFLEEKGLLEVIHSTELERAAKASNIKEFKDYFEKHKGTVFFSSTEILNMESIFAATLINPSGPPVLPISIYKSNFIALLNKAVKGEDITPIYSDRQINPNQVHGKEYEILQLVLNKMPMPSVDVSLEEIIDLKTDSDLKRKFLALRNWMIEIQKGNFNRKELEEKFDYLYLEYENAMKLHKIRIGHGSFKAFVITSAEILENLVTVKWSKAAEAAFRIFESRTRLAELEMNTFGRELAYIYELNNRLSKK